MSWDRYDFDEQSHCACGKGKVIKHCYREDDDWNRSREGCTGVDIECSDCKLKYHYVNITRYRYCLPWKGDGFYTHEYLVPIGLDIPKVIEERSCFWCNTKEEIVCSVTKSELQDVIKDMKENKYSTRVKMIQSKTIIYICKKRFRTKSLNKIIPILQEIYNSYEQYQWNPDTIIKYKQQELEKIKKNEENIAEVISKSYELHFS
ncbi:hypothetical protein [Filifactor alocis]|uniref:hypothetical protein n=1 Tax=Filifactor alocis TaxID=143361 RepID=UPI003F9F54EE